MNSDLLMGRSIRVDTPIRCDYDHLLIQKGKYGLQVNGDPEKVKAQGFYHGKLCFEAALKHYEEKRKGMLNG